MQDDFETKRIISHCFHDKEISLLEFSVYHNLIVIVNLFCFYLFSQF